MPPPIPPPRHGHSLLLLRRLRDHGLGGDHESGDRRSVLQSDAHDLGRVHDAAFSMSTYCSVWALKPKVCDLFSCAFLPLLGPNGNACFGSKAVSRPSTLL